MAKPLAKLVTLLTSPRRVGEKCSAPRLATAHGECRLVCFDNAMRVHLLSWCRIDENAATGVPLAKGVQPMARFLGLAAISFAVLAGPTAAAPLDAPKRVLFVGNEETPRTRAFVELLKKHFARVEVADRKTFEPSAAADSDVVLLDWSQRDAKFPHDPSPLGKREAWKKPTVFLGSAGLLVAVQWQIIGGSG